MRIAKNERRIRRITMEKIKEWIGKNRIASGIVAIAICVVIVGAVVYIVIYENGGADRKRATKLADAAVEEIASIKEEIPQMDRDTFITVDNKVVVGFVSIPDKNIKYPVINVFDKNTCSYSLCRQGENMPWDIEGMTVCIDSFTDVLDHINDKEMLVFEDVTGKKYEYEYQKEVKEKIVDYGIKICKVNESGKISKEYWFVKK